MNLDLKISPQLEAMERGLNQVYSHGLEMTMLGPDFQIVFPWVFCKDYFNDVLYGLKHRRRLSIFGFKFDPENIPDGFADELRLCFRWKKHSITLRKASIVAAKIIRSIEQSLGIEKKTRLLRATRIGGEHGYTPYIFIADKVWMQHPAFLAFYIVIVRACVENKQFELPDNTNYLDWLVQHPSGKDSYVVGKRKQLEKLLRFMHQSYHNKHDDELAEFYDAFFEPTLGISSVHNNGLARALSYCR
jgi:hypothetical protein